MNEHFIIELVVKKYSYQDDYDRPSVYPLFAIANKFKRPEERIVALLYQIELNTNTDICEFENLVNQETMEALYAITMNRDESYVDYITRAAKNDIARRVLIESTNDPKVKIYMEHGGIFQE